MSLRGVALQQRENPAEANLILISCPFREIATLRSQWHKYFVRKIIFSLITPLKSQNFDVWLSLKRREFWKIKNSLKSQNFDEIVVFSAGSGKSSVLGVHDFSGSAEKAEYRKIMTF